MKKLILCVLFGMVSTGCVTYEKCTFTFDYNTGMVEEHYYNIMSQKGLSEKDYSIEKDWESLKNMLSDFYTESPDNDVIKPLNIELFKEKKVLSGKRRYQVVQPKAFPSKVVLLDKLLQEFEDSLVVNGLDEEIFIFSKRNGSTSIISSNGKEFITDKSIIAVWPTDEAKFEFTVKRDSKGKTLLPFYLKDNK